MKWINKLITEFSEEGIHSNKLELKQKSDIEIFESELGNELLKFLSIKNGFYAFDKALHVFPLGDKNSEQELLYWNGPVWKDTYKTNTDHIFCFAENVFGEQFCISQNTINRFDPETTELEVIAKSIDEWAKNIIDDYDYLTGYSISNNWQQINGVIKPYNRLIPKIPFVLGGDFKIQNLYSANALKGMHSRANIANQIHDLPDGSKIKFDIIE